MSAPRLKADYRAPDISETFTSTVPSPPADGTVQDVATKTAYLSALRSGVTELQGNVNTFLTQRMEDEKAAQSGATASRKTKEEREEEMYGEEDPEDA
ncbi:uncharacterized protein LTR77_000501 [Saxophila tyrrhenica]|uniref:EKC/KEOPS complex subunit GON7 n=1 Tax=Saxophila tyrrhenica TaxID=1690608 RepID=A0AAV9PRC0_9PEZI|nr:hypothetical protein LTR77_000501 [Saxophila tyrrhenica]